MKRCCIALFFSLIVVNARASTLIVEEGEPRAIIVTADDPSQITLTAATEFQRFIESISGAKIPIRSLAETGPQAGDVRILVGPSKAVQDLDIEVPSGCTFKAQEEGFVLKTVAQDIIVAGNEEGPYQGTVYAAYELLERLGCHWYFPGEFGQVIPKRSTIRVPELDITARPSFPSRNIWRAGWADNTDGYEEWAIRNKMNSRIYAFPGDGSIRNLAPPEKYFDKYPEIYALSEEGERVAKGSYGVHGQHEETMLCLSNPLTVKIASETICDYFRANPEANSYGFSPPDGAPRCFCKTCVAADHDFMNDRDSEPSVSDAYFNFVNNVAHAVCGEFPDRYIVTLAYSNRVRPPEGLEKPFHPNIIVQIARLGVCTMHPLGSPDCVFARRYLDTLKAWSRICPQLLIYDYDPQSDLSRMPFWNVHSIRKNLPIYHQHGVLGFTTEGHNTFLRTGLNYYIRTKLMWDVNADVDDLLDDFYRNFFGPAAVPMQQFIEAIETMMDRTPAHIRWTSSQMDWPEIFPEAKTIALGEFLDRAEQLANSPEVHTRIAVYREVHRYMTLYLKHVQSIREGRFLEAFKMLDELAQPMQAVEKIQPGLYPPDGQYVQQRERGMGSLRRRVVPLVERDGGELGDRIALAPDHAQFRTDPYNEGLFQQWHRDSVAETLKWDTVSLHTDWTLNGYRDASRQGYQGYAWYRFAAPVSEDFINKPIILYIPRAYGEKLWVWANEYLVHSPTDDEEISQIDIDVSQAVRCGGQNIFTCRIFASKESLQRGGLAARPLLWTPTDADD
ncbi:MAG: DUF4838 domain-containing protein [bacterium]